METERNFGKVYRNTTTGALAIQLCVCIEFEREEKKSVL